MGTNHNMKLFGLVFSTTLLVAASSGCTQQLENSFRLAQQEEAFNSTTDVNTKLDMLWVVDNSASMDVNQQHLRDGISAFASRYMQPTWDIRIAVITSDTYLGNTGFANYVNSTLGGSTGWKSEYIIGNANYGVPGRTSAFVNPSWAPTLFNLTVGNANYGKATGGIKVKDHWPYYARNWSTLQAGNHDGPMTTLCTEFNRLFWQGLSHCTYRDNQAGTGIDQCVTPGGGQTSVTQCVNTSMADNIHSGKPIISTMPPAGTPGDAAWTAQLVKDFTVNVSVGSSGSGSERPLSSMLQFVTDNEASASLTKFFRPGSLRTIVFLTDEDDQSMTIPANNANPGSNYTGSCSSKTVDGYTYTIDSCPSVALTPVSTFKSQMDAFFQGLDGSGAAGDPNYFVVSIVALTGASIQAMQTERCNVENGIFGPGSCSVATDRADRLVSFASLVGNGSLSMDLGSSDYSPMLDQIGTVIVQKKAQFTLARAPTAAEDMIVYVLHADQSRTVVDPSKWTINGNILTITDLNFVLSLASTDKFLVNYQPRSVQ